MSIDKIENLKAELSTLQKKNQLLYEEKIQPVLTLKVQEFLDAFEDYFRERGFVVKKEHQSVRVAFDSLEFTALSNENHDIFIMKDREPIASITVKHKTTKAESYSKDAGLVNQLETEIEREKRLLVKLEHPTFFYTGSEFGYQYDSPLSVLDSIFHV